MERKLFKLKTKEEPKLYSKEKLWIAVKKFVYKMCNKYTKLETFSQPFDEILSIALISFCKAYDTYKILSGITFISYLSKIINNDVLLAYRYCKNGEKYYNRKKEELSIEEPIGIDNEGNKLTFLDILSNNLENTVYDYIENKELINTINFCINNILTEKEKIVLYYRLESLTQQKISDILGVSRSYISRLELKACNKIRKYLKKNKLI